MGSHRLVVLVLFLALVVTTGSRASAGDPPATPTYATPHEAGEALLQALEAEDASAALIAMFGPDARDLVDTEDAAADRLVRRNVLLLGRQALDVEVEDGRAVLLLGHARWPFPVPLVPRDGRHAFDLDAGRAEILLRRVGHDELQAIAMMRAFPTAQREYAAVDRDGDGALEYAMRLASSPGTRDGLWWPTGTDELPSPLAAIAATAPEYVSERGEGEPWFGYRFRVLTKQGCHAPGGAYDYRAASGDLLGGFALIAYPASYRTLGVMTFIVGREGRVYERDLGPDTTALAAAIDTFDPDETWSLVP